MADTIVNKIAESGLITIDLEDYYPKEEIAVFDLKPYLFMELILKEKEFRASLQAVDWTQYKEKIVAVTCTADAIIPVWAYMLVTSSLEPYAREVVFGDRDEALKQSFIKNIRTINVNEYDDKRIVIKGCGDKPIGEFAYLEITKLLRPLVKSMMYGEPCSTVPVYKKK